MPNLTICVTHSSRSMEYQRATLNFLTKRYASPDRLKNPPPLQTLTDEYNPKYIGNVSLWRWDPRADREPQLLEFIEKKYKTQHAVIVRDRLVICGTAFLEIYDLQRLNGEPKRIITHPWFCGAHTVFVDSRDRLVVSCSAPDALLLFDWTGNLVEHLRMPEELYGSNYRLNSADDLRRHYIHNDLQLTHINCGFPCERGYLCCALIQGAIGIFAPDGSYREITRGFVGCHGARTRPGLDGFYFSDSTNGNLVEMDWSGRVTRRFQVDSRWLHDAQAIDAERCLMSLSDHNAVELWNTIEDRLIWRIDCARFGSTCQFLSVSP